MGLCSEDSFPIKNRVRQLPDLVCRLWLTHRPVPTRVCCLPSILLLSFAVAVSFLLPFIFKLLLPLLFSGRKGFL